MRISIRSSNSCIWALSSSTPDQSTRRATPLIHLCRSSTSQRCKTLKTSRLSHRKSMWNRPDSSLLSSEPSSSCSQRPITTRTEDLHIVNSITPSNSFQHMIFRRTISVHLWPLLMRTRTDRSHGKTLSQLESMQSNHSSQEIKLSTKIRVPSNLN